jgi:glyoxylase-like metal-dependent hydrolase (beta-lactamase superfamily II)
MVTRLNRRRFLGATLAGTVTATLPKLACGQGYGAAVTAQQLTDNITLLSGAGTNIIALRGPDGVALVDGGLREHAAQVLELVAALGGAPRVELLFNSNWRAEHTGLNRDAIAGGSAVVAHENTRLWMANDFTVEWENLV